MRRTWTIYALVDPRDGTRRYVGRTSNLAGRVAGHRTAWRSGGASPGKVLSAWLAGLHASGRWPFRVDVLGEVRSFGGAKRAEAKWIRKGMTEGWPLTNAHPGGGSGGVPAEIRQRLSRIRRAQWAAAQRAREEEQAKWERTVELDFELDPDEFAFVRGEAERRGEDVEDVLLSALDQGLRAIMVDRRKAVAA
jgi:hypothetical protein